MVRRCVKKSSGQEYAAKIINTKKLSARGTAAHHAPSHRLVYLCVVLVIIPLSIFFSFLL